MNRDEEAIREFKADCEQEAKEDQLYNHRLHTDWEFAVEDIAADRLTEIDQYIHDIVTELSVLGWNVNRQEIVDLI